MQHEHETAIPRRRKPTRARWVLLGVCGVLLGCVLIGWVVTPQYFQKVRTFFGMDGGKVAPPDPSGPGGNSSENSTNPDGNPDTPDIPDIENNSPGKAVPQQIVQQACSAAYEGKFAVVKQLVAKYPAVVNGRDEDQGATPLQWAVDRDQRDIISYLLAQGADVNARGNQGVSSLHRTALQGNTALAKYLLTHGADINIKDHTNATPLINAAGKGHLETVQLLLAHRPDVNVQETNGKWSALHAAILNKHTAIVKALLAHGADVTARNIFDMSPLQCAQEMKLPEIVALLKKAGAKE